MRVEEKRVVSPRERVRSLVKVLVLRDRREFAAVLVFDVLFMFGVFLLNPTHPERREDCCCPYSESDARLAVRCPHTRGERNIEAGKDMRTSYKLKARQRLPT